MAPEEEGGESPQRGGCLSRHRSEEHTSELQSPCNLVCRLLLEKKKKNKRIFQLFAWNTCASPLWSVSSIAFTLAEYSISYLSSSSSALPLLFVLRTCAVILHSV